MYRNLRNAFQCLKQSVDRKLNDLKSIRFFIKEFIICYSGNRKIFTNLAESLIDLFRFRVLTDTDGGEMRTLTPASSCIAIK